MYIYIHAFQTYSHTTAVFFNNPYSIYSRMTILYRVRPNQFCLLVYNPHELVCYILYKPEFTKLQTNLAIMKAINL